MTVVLSSIALVSAWAIWWSWRKRYQTEQRARDLAHELGNLMAILHLNVQQLDPHGRTAPDDLVRDIENASIAIYRVFDRWRGRQAQLELPTSDHLLRSLCGLLGRVGLEVRTRIVAPLPHRGDDEEMVRVLQSLLFDAGREAVRARDPRVEVEMTATELRIESPVRASTGEPTLETGVNSAREAAARIGWRIDRALEGERAIVRVKPA